MSQEYAITTVGPPRPWQNKRGDQMVSYDVGIEGVYGTVEWARKPDSDPPVAGSTTPLSNIEDTTYGKKLKVDWDAVKAGGSGGPPATSSAGSANFGGDYQRPLRPEVQRAIQRQHSQEMALRFLALNRQSPSYEDVFKAADAFDADINRQTPPQGSGGSPLVGAAPQAPSTHPAPAQSSVVDTSEIEMALQGAYVGIEASKMIAAYMVQELEPSRTVEAIRKLTDFLDAPEQKKTVDALTRLTETALGHDLPVDSAPDDSIPFHHPEYREPGFERLRWRF